MPYDGFTREAQGAANGGLGQAEHIFSPLCCADIWAVAPRFGRRVRAGTVPVPEYVFPEAAASMIWYLCETSASPARRRR